MANYIDKKKEVIKEVVKVKSKDVDVDSITNSIIQAIDSKLKIVNIGQNNFQELDTFDNSNTINRLAKEMLVERGNSESNFKTLGNIKETKNNNEDVDNTIDLLKGID